MLTMILAPDPARPWRFVASLAGEPIVTSDQPVVDAARELLRRRHDPAALLTARHAGSAVAAFRPVPIGQWARWTYEEGRAGLRQRKWAPRAEGLAKLGGGTKSGGPSDPVALDAP